MRIEEGQFPSGPSAGNLLLFRSSLAQFVKPDQLDTNAVLAVNDFETQRRKLMANTSKRGFASMDPSKQREIASKGGRAAHSKGTAHEFTSDEARVAGRKGGEAVSRDRAHMSAIGREGGHSRGRTRQPLPGESPSVATDTEGQNYIGRADDRGTFGAPERSVPPRQESGNDFRPDDSANRRSF